MRAVRAAFVLVVVLVLQASVFAQLPMLGARADVVLLAVIAATTVGGAEQGAVAGFVAGMMFDLIHAEPWPLGLSALTYCLAGYLVGSLAADGAVPKRVLAASGSVIGVFLFAALGVVLDVRGLVNGHLVTVALVVATVNALLIGPAVRIARWVLGVRGRRSLMHGRLLP